MDLLLILVVSLWISIAVGQQHTNSTLNAHDTSARTLTLCVLVEINTTGKVYDYRRAAAAIDLGIDYVANNLLTGYHLQKIYSPLEDVCSLKTNVIASAMELIDRGVNCSVYIGPGCGMSAETLSDVAEYYDIPIIGVPAASLGISAVSSFYPVVVRVSFTYAAVAEVLLRLFYAQNYTTPTFLVDQTITTFSQMGTLTQATISRRDFELFTQMIFVPFNGRNTTDEDIEKILRKTSLRSRIIVIYSEGITTRRILLIARQLGMTNGDYAFIGIELYGSPVWGSFSWKQQDINDDAARDAYQALLLLSLQTDPRLKTNAFYDKVKKISKEKYDYEFDEDELLDLMIVHFFDSVLVFGQIFAEGFRTFSRKIGGHEFTNLLINRTLKSPLSGKIHFNQARDKVSDFEIRGFSFSTGRHEAVYSLLATETGIKNDGTLEWFGRETLPANAPQCGFDGNNPICQVISTVTTNALFVVPVLFIIVVCVGAYFIIERVYFTEKDPFWWRSFLHEIEATMTNYVSSAESMAVKADSATDNENPQQSTHLSQAILNEDQLMQTKVEFIQPKVVTIEGVLCSLYELPDPKQKVPKDLSKDLRLVRRLQHNNIQNFLRIVLNNENLCAYVVAELCSRGNLRDLLTDSKMDLDWVFSQSLLKDLVYGMTYLHSSRLVSHGNLTDEHCQIDSRFVLKISGHGLGTLQDPEDLRIPEIQQTGRNWRKALYRAPELLRRTAPPNGTQKGDVYSFGILIQQIVLWTDPFVTLSNREQQRKSMAIPNIIEIVMEVKRGSTPPTRPSVRISSCPANLYELMENCYNEDPALRPTFARVRLQLQKIFKKSHDDIVDHLIKKMEKYAGELELEAETKTKQFMEERQRSNNLLLHILPKTVAQALLQGEIILPQTYSSTTVYFGDVDGFTVAQEALTSPSEIVNLLNKLYSVYDEILPKYDVYQVEAINDAYLIVSGLPVVNGTRHVAEIAALALEARTAVKDMETGSEMVSGFQLRVGINSGSCVAGVVGLQLPRYCLFGDTINTASRMESHGEAGKIHCSESTKHLLDEYSEYLVVSRGEIPVKASFMKVKH